MFYASFETDDIDELEKETLLCALELHKLLNINVIEALKIIETHHGENRVREYAATLLTK